MRRRREWALSLRKQMCIALIRLIDAMLNSKVLLRLFYFLPLHHFRVSRFRPAFIMDGNRRFAALSNHKSPKSLGLDKFLDVIEYCRKLGIKEVSFFVLSKQNLGRPREEMEDMRRVLGTFEKTSREGVRIRVIGDMTLLEKDDRLRIDAIVQKTRRNRQITANLFVAYSSECSFDGKVDALIRTGGDRRLSDFLLKQVSEGASITFLSCFWPEITCFHIILVYWKFVLEKWVVRHTDRLALFRENRD